jgi:hypothetical protein
LLPLGLITWNQSNKKIQRKYFRVFKSTRKDALAGNASTPALTSNKKEEHPRLLSPSPFQPALLLGNEINLLTLACVFPCFSTAEIIALVDSLLLLFASFTTVTRV